MNLSISPGSTLWAHKNVEINGALLLISTPHTMSLKTSEDAFWKSLAQGNWSVKSKMTSTKPVYNTHFSLI